MVEKIFHNVKITVFIKEEQDFDAIQDSFLELFPFGLQEAKVKLNKTQAQIVEDRKMIILDVLLTRNRQINDFMNNILSKMSSDVKKTIVEQIDTRIDEESNFYFRIDKDEFMNNNKIVLTDGGNCFHFKCHVATYPQNVENAKKVVVEFFEK